MKRTSCRSGMPAGVSGLVLALALATGCADGGAVGVGPSDPGTFDPGGIEDPGTIVPDAVEEDVAPERDEGPAGDVLRDALVTAPWVPSPSVRFQAGVRDGDAWTVEVVARDLPAVFGIALRIDFDPARLAFVDAELPPVFGAEGEGGIYRAAEVRPGSVTLASSHRSYMAETALAGDTVVARLKVRPLSGAPVDLSFFAARSLVLTRRLEAVAVTYLPATLHP